MPQPRILVTGAGGQLGSVLVAALRQRFPDGEVLASDLRESKEKSLISLDVLDKERIEDVIEEYQIDQIYHLAAILSAKGEENPISTWNINMNAWLNILEVSRAKQLEKVFYPSSIAVFGSDTPKQDTPQFTHLAPETIYGISKEAGENWGLYYFNKYGLDVRSVRYPGLIGHESMPGGGTTDYAVDIFHKAVANEDFICFLKEDTALPMMYMPDAVRATLELMDAPKESIRIRTSYNLGGMSFTPSEIHQEIKKHKPDFKISYEPDFRQSIAATWVDSVDDSRAKEDWGWKEEYDLSEMVRDMLSNLMSK